MSPTETERHHRFLRSFTAHELAIRAFVRRLVPSRVDADDVMQEVAVVLWDKFDTFREEENFGAWAFGVARFEVLAWLRDKARDKILLSEEVVLMIAEETVKEESSFARQREILESCLDKLPSDQRAILMRAYQPEQKIQSVAHESGRTIAGFYQWLYRIRKTLLDCVHRTIAQEAS